jgi:hypothetical protein
MGTIHLDSPLDEVLGGMADENDFNNPSEHSLENDEDEWHDALINTDEEYPFQRLAPPPITRSFPSFEAADKFLHQWTAARGYALRINRTNWVDKYAVIKEPKYRSFVYDRADA